MKINSITQSFSAKLVRNPYFVHHQDFTQPIKVQQSLEDTVQEYDKQISIIERHKQAAIELDRFMSSEETKSMLEELPEEDEIIIKSQYNPAISAISYSGNIVLTDMTLQYAPKNEESKNKYVNLQLFEKKQISNQNVGNAKGLDEEKVIQWLNNVRRIFGNQS